MIGKQLRWLVCYVAAVFSLLHRSGGDCARILGIFPFTAQSHFVVFQSLMHELASRGHDVVVISHFPQREVRPNYTDISLAGSMRTYLNIIPFSDVAVRSWNPFTGLLQLHHFLLDYEPIFHVPEIQRLMRSNEHFDLIIVELFNTDMFLGFVHKFQVPFIYISSSNLLPWSYVPFGSPDNPAYMSVIFQPYSDRMTFQQRLLNTMHNVASVLAYKYIFAPYSEKVAHRYFGSSLPPLRAISNNASLLLVNTHHTILWPKPLMPTIVEVGGIHLKAPSPLPQNLAHFMNSSRHGVVYFCLGSMLRAETLPDAKRQLFMQAFTQIPELNFLWKWEGQGPFAGQPSNLMTAAWLPQQDILAHPKTRVFISHGGMLGITEAISNGVPILGIPMYGDQGNNVAAVVANGAGIMLDYYSLSTDSVYTALRRLLNDPEYLASAQRLSRLFRDRPRPPLETAVYWTEYVLRHRDMSQLRSAAIDLPWYQYFLLDIAAAYLLVASLTAALLFVAVRTVIQFFFSRNITVWKTKND